MCVKYNIKTGKEEEITRLIWNKHSVASQWGMGIRVAEQLGLSCVCLFFVVVFYGAATILKASINATTTYFRIVLSSRPLSWTAPDRRRRRKREEPAAIIYNVTVF